MKVCLIKLPPTYANWYRRPLLGLSTLSAVLRKNGHDCKILDAYYHGWSEEELERAIVEYQPDLVGISAMTYEINRGARLLARVKDKLKIPVVAGGPHVTALPERTLRDLAAYDYCVTGEGEATLLELVEALEGRRAVESVNGLCHRTADGSIKLTPARIPLSAAELDALPFPDFEQYYPAGQASLAASGGEYVIMTGRGCPFTCSFCQRVHGRKPRNRRPESVIAEMEMAVEKYGATSFDFYDEIFLYDNQHVRATLKMMMDTGLSRKVKWMGLTRPNLVNEDIIALAKASGCRRLGMGVETGDPAIMEKIHRKGVSLDQVREAVRIIKKAGLAVNTFYILGHPYETRESALKTVELAAELNTTEIAVGVMAPYPGTEVYELAKRGEAGYRLLSEDWDKYDKYGGEALEIAGLPLPELKKLQMKAYVRLYVRNMRIMDLLKFIWERRGAFFYFLKTWSPSSAAGGEEAAANRS